MHYSATPESSIPLEPRGLYLIDSGGQYYEGTTDITRTIAMGPVTDEEKEHFTLVLMSMLRLGDVKFLHGCRGSALIMRPESRCGDGGLTMNTVPDTG